MSEVIWLKRGMQNSKKCGIVGFVVGTCKFCRAKILPSFTGWIPAESNVNKTNFKYNKQSDSNPATPHGHHLNTIRRVAQSLELANHSPQAERLPTIINRIEYAVHGDKAWNSALLSGSDRPCLASTDRERDSDRQMRSKKRGVWKPWRLPGNTCSSHSPRFSIEYAEPLVTT